MGGRFDGDGRDPGRGTGEPQVQPGRPGAALAGRLPFRLPHVDREGVLGDGARGGPGRVQHQAAGFDPHRGLSGGRGTADRDGDIVVARRHRIVAADRRGAGAAGRQRPRRCGGRVRRADAGQRPEAEDDHCGSSERRSVPVPSRCRTRAEHLL